MLERNTRYVIFKEPHRTRRPVVMACLNPSPKLSVMSYWRFVQKKLVIFSTLVAFAWLNRHPRKLQQWSTQKSWSIRPLESELTRATMTGNTKWEMRHIFRILASPNWIAHAEWTMNKYLLTTITTLNPPMYMIEQWQKISKDTQNQCPLIIHGGCEYLVSMFR